MGGALSSGRRARQLRRCALPLRRGGMRVRSRNRLRIDAARIWVASLTLRGSSANRIRRSAPHGGYGRRLSRQVFSQDDRIEIFKSPIRQPVPGLVAPEKFKAEITANGQCLTVRTQAHHRVVNVAVARIEDVAMLVAQSGPLHI